VTGASKHGGNKANAGGGPGGAGPGKGHRLEDLKVDIGGGSGLSPVEVWFGHVASPPDLPFGGGQCPNGSGGIVGSVKGPAKPLLVPFMRRALPDC
jgi:hypothetical protein